ncbi:putative leucine-rich repeat-containing protein DDB_G0290503 [Venturia canescens]|uniref:putative leucine-rich repeat-containing protein DDB_G0290503 n=1 Tax=Venturia canescens TaxID=32260 RepID=UPI001C9C3A38|nr:putative leucine-rich repeat-containing protein DDB_G0290503 [Venturia canescens]
MPGCAAIGCNNRSEKGFTMKCFPRNPKLRKIWTERVSRADWEPSNNSFLCHVHFEADQWTITQSGRIKLKKNAIPSIFTVTSTRKSPRKRRKLVHSEEEDIYIIEYLDDPTNHKISSKTVNSSYGCYSTSNLPTIVRSGFSRSSCRTTSESVMDTTEMPETIVVSDGMSDESIKEIKGANGVTNDSKVSETPNDSEVVIKKESPPNSNHELDEIEEKLRFICDGEPQKDDKNTIEKEINRKCQLDEDKSMTAKFNEDEKTTPKDSSSGNNEKCTKSQENVGINSSNRKRQSTFEITSDAKKPPVTNGIISSNVNYEKPETESSATAKRSTFTIKLTGIDEDVTEIVEGLGTEPILKYKSSNDSSNTNKNLVTSVISVTDNFVIKSENWIKNTERKLESRLSPSLEIKQEPEINGIEDKSSTKLSLEPPGDDDDSTDRQQLRKKVKFQEDVIRKLRSQLNASKEAQSSTNYINTRSQTKGKVIIPKSCNGDCQNESKDKLIKDLSKKIEHSNETISRLHKSLNEERQNVKNALLQIRQRDNRIKEMNWKLNKASKYIERAEKNANNYRKKMTNLQNILAKKNLEAETCRNSNNFKLTVPADTIRKEYRTFSSDVCSAVIVEENDHETTNNENVIYQTVQDIFEESNHGDDDPMIDNPEDFMRQFAGSL